MHIPKKLPPPLDCARERRRPRRRRHLPQASNDFGGSKRQYDQRPCRGMHRMVSEQAPKHPEKIAVSTDIGSIEPEDNIMVGVERPRCLQERRRVRCKIAA